MSEAAAMLEMARKLSRAEQTIEALISGQIDAVVDPASNSPILLFKAQHELRKSEELYKRERDRAQRFLDAAEVLLLAMDVYGTVTLINRYGAKLLGWEPEDLIGKSWVDTCVPERYRNSVRETIHALVSGGASLADTRILLRSGGERVIEWRNRVLLDEHGSVNGIFTCGTDVTERNLANDSIRIADERVHFALEAAGIGIWDMNYRTGELQWSELLEAQYGIAPGQFPGTLQAFIDGVHPDDRDALLATMKDAGRTGQDFVVTHRTLRPDGSVRWLKGAGRIRLDSEGQPERGVGISQDVTQSHLLEMRAQQGQKMEAIGRLASGVAHDFNNLLTVIIGFADLMTTEVPQASQHGNDLNEILKAAQRATGLTKQLLAFSRQQLLNVSKLDMNALIEDMSGMFGRLIGEDIKVTLDLGKGGCHAFGDKNQMEQVIMNLVVNARDAMPNGGDLHISTAVARLENSAFHEETIVDGSYVMIAITDSGHGMTKETQRRLFEPFFTTRETGKGTGLGLATTYGIVKQSQGYIWVYSEIDVGTTFKVYIPCAGVTSDVLGCEVTAPPKAAVISELVLLVEDEAAVRQLSKRILVNAGYEVVEASNGAEAEAEFAATRRPIHLIVTDVVMPGASGPDTVVRLRHKAPHLKVLYMSGYTEQSAAHRAGLGAGAAFIQKPFTAQELLRTVRETLDAPLVAGSLLS